MSGDVGVCGSFNLMVIFGAMKEFRVELSDGNGENWVLEFECLSYTLPI